MSAASVAYLKRALFWLVTTTAMYLLMNGAQIFETALIVPAWTAAPPASLGMFQGPYRLDFKAFWIAFHSIHELTFVAALVVCWRLTVVRRWLLVLLVLHVLVRVWTIAYFAPTIIAFQSVPVSSAVDPLLAQKAAQWRHLNIVRVLIFLAVNLAMLSPIRQVHRMLVAATFATRDLGDP
jgi:hypothetical protein